MPLFIRRSPRRYAVRLICVGAGFFILSSLLIVTLQDLIDSSSWSRSLSLSIRSDDKLRCPPLDVVGVELVKILRQWEPAQNHEVFRWRDGLEHNKGGGEGERGGAEGVVAVAVQTLTNNQIMMQEENTRRLFYLADVLQSYKELLLLMEGKEQNEPKKKKTSVEDAIIDENIVELVKVFENVTSSHSKKQMAPPVYLDTHKINNSSLKLWQLFHNDISQYSLYPEDSRWVDRLLVDMASLPVKQLSPLNDDGTQIKLVFVLEDDQRVLFKPKRLPRDYEEPLDRYYMYEFERYTAEIAAFHLDRLLGFRRVPPVAGRYIDMLTDIFNHSNEKLQDTFYKSPIGNQCFYGICQYFCDPGHGVCGNLTVLEGSFASYLPSRLVAPRILLANPWARSYSKYDDAKWETVEDGREYCLEVRTKEPWDDDAALLNIIDAHIFDFLAGNKDRHHFEVFKKYGNTSYPILFDNGKGFGRAAHDIISILAPLQQCCMIRTSTLKRLIELETGPIKLSELMKQSLSNDVISDILTEQHLESLDRRVRIILEEVYECILSSGADRVIINN